MSIESPHDQIDDLTKKKEIINRALYDVLRPLINISHETQLHEVTEDHTVVYRSVITTIFGSAEVRIYQSPYAPQPTLVDALSAARFTVLLPFYTLFYVFHHDPRKLTNQLPMIVQIIMHLLGGTSPEQYYEMCALFDDEYPFGHYDKTIAELPSRVERCNQLVDVL